jgi:hypothetical protein
MNTPSPWSFYGRQSEVRALAEVLRRQRWFFIRISGRRRIGKTALVRQAVRAAGLQRVAFVQIDDTDAAGVVATARRHFALCGVPESMLPTDLRSLATCIADLAADGWVVVLDEFQYFSRKSLFVFNSMLQFEVDRFRLGERAATGGVVLLGSLHTEMMALLEDRRAPLYGRLSGGFHVTHLDAPAVIRMWQEHTDGDPSRLFFLWGLFQGVPKYWQDAWELNLLSAPRRELLRGLFFEGPAPLRDEGPAWLLEELHGRYDLFLRYIAHHPGCTRADILAHADGLKGFGDGQPGFYLTALEQRFGLIRRREPAFAAPSGRQGRYVISDNFLQAWLGALADPVALSSLRPVEDLLERADTLLASTEGWVLEQLAAWLYQEQSRLGVSDFPLTAAVTGWWDRTGAEVDLVAQNADARQLRLGSCKRSADKLVADLPRFNNHIARLLDRNRQFADWEIQKVAIAPLLSPAHRQAITAAGYIPQDLTDLTRPIAHISG